MSRALLSDIAAGGVTLGFQVCYFPFLSPQLRLVLGTTLFCAVYLAMLLYLMGQKLFYLDILRGFMHGSSVDEEIPVSV